MRGICRIDISASTGRGAAGDGGRFFHRCRPCHGVSDADEAARGVYAFFDGEQFAQIGKGTRRIMTLFLYFAIKSLYWSKGGTLKKILWCDDDSIKSYFIDAGKNLTYTNLRRQISDSLEDKPFPPLSKELQKHTYFEFGSIEDHFKYRQAVMEAYPCGHYPVFEGYDHMQYQIRDPKGFAEMLAHIAERDCMPELPFIRK